MAVGLVCQLGWAALKQIGKHAPLLAGGLFFSYLLAGFYGGFGWAAFCLTFLWARSHDWLKD